MIKNDFQLTLPSAFDEAGIRMLDSIREIFDILEIEFESVRFDLVQYKTFKQLARAIQDGKCPVVDVLNRYMSFQHRDGSHVMVATGIKDTIGFIKHQIQLKNSYADNPNVQGKVHQ